MGEKNNEQSEVVKEGAASVSGTTAVISKAVSKRVRRLRKRSKESSAEKSQPVLTSAHKEIHTMPAQAQNPLGKILSISFGAFAVIAIVISGVASQYYKGRVLPNVAVVGVNMGGKRDDAIKSLLAERQSKLNITLQTNDKVLKPTLQEIGYTINIDKTIANARQAKRDSGILAKVQFWHTVDVPAVISINDTLLSQYVETNAPEIIKPPTDAKLVFDAKTTSFSVTSQASGEGADMLQLKANLAVVGNTLLSTQVPIVSTLKGPNITESDLQALVEPADELVKRRIVLNGQGYTFTARPSDIASWVTPTPRKDGSVRLVIDPAKIQSYVEGIGKKISSAPLDTKVLKDETTGQEVIIQQGRDGTELADKQQLADAIANSLAARKDITQSMNIKVAAQKVVNMNAYDKWIEVDLSEQRTTAYERATPIKNFVIASGTRGHETVKGEFAIWHKNRKQTMQGGSKADGSYYSIPNVEWVSYFYQDYALHGAWWREKFGYPASHGCVNMTNTDAQWVYEWAPIGTKVIVHD